MESIVEIGNTNTQHATEMEVIGEETHHQRQNKDSIEEGKYRQPM